MYSVLCFFCIQKIYLRRMWMIDQCAEMNRILCARRDMGDVMLFWIRDKAVLDIVLSAKKTISKHAWTK